MSGRPSTCWKASSDRSGGRATAPGLLVLHGMLEADEFPDEGVVTGIGVAGFGAEQPIETVLGLGDPVDIAAGQVETGALQPRPADEDEARRRRDAAGTAIVEPRGDESASRVMVELVNESR